MPEETNMFVEAVQGILADTCTPAQVRQAEQNQKRPPVWDALAQAGFLDILAPEEHGGAGLPLPEFYPICRLLGQYAVPAPVAETMAARALLAGKVACPKGSIAIAPRLTQDAGGIWHADMVPHGAAADAVLGTAAKEVWLLDAASATRATSGIWSSRMAALAWPAGSAAQRINLHHAILQALGAAIYAALLCGAMERVFRLTLQYCNDRAQFGRSLGKFQAVQHQLAVMAEHLAAASVAAEAAFQVQENKKNLGVPLAPSPLAAAIAKARASEAALLVANTAHALHGAIGITEAYDLQLYTRRLHTWRMFHGAEDYWHRWIGRSALASDAAGLCDFVRAA